MDPMDREVARIAEGSNEEPTEEGTSPGLKGVDLFTTPGDFKYWSKKKQLEFQRKKLIKL